MTIRRTLDNIPMWYCLHFDLDALSDKVTITHEELVGQLILSAATTLSEFKSGVLDRTPTMILVKTGSVVTATTITVTYCPADTNPDHPFPEGYVFVFKRGSLIREAFVDRDLLLATLTV